MSENKNKNTEVKETTKEAVDSTPQIPDGANEIRETTGADMEVYDDYDVTDLADSAPKKKKFKKRYAVIGIAALIIAAFIIYRINAAKGSAVYVETQDVALGTIENVLSISGTVQSGETQNYYSDVTAPIEKLNVKVGDKVSEGFELLTYDTEALDLAQKNAELAIKQAKGSYNTAAAGTVISSEAKAYSQNMNMTQISDRIDAITHEIDAINNKIIEKQNRMNRTLTDLQKTAQDINQNGIMDGAMGGGLDYDYIDRRLSDNNDDMSESNKQMVLAVQESIYDVQYALQNDPEITGWKNQITSLQEEQNQLSSALKAKASGGSVAASKAALDSTQLSQEDTISKIEAAKEGIKAEYDGVVTVIPANVAEGATVTAGTQLLTIANLEDVQIAIQVSKSDLPKIALGQKVDVTINGKPYSGEITKISGNATKNTNGVAVVETIIKVTNPDSDIIFGVEASNKIHAQKADNTIVLPYEYVQTDSTGDYVYVLAADNTVQRKDVVIGISTSTEAQITEGLEVGDKVITSDASLLTEGMTVAVMPQQ